MQKETNISYLLATPSHYVLYVRSSRMSELSRFVYMKSHVTLHVKASAQKVNYIYRLFKNKKVNEVIYQLFVAAFNKYQPIWQQEIACCKT